MDLVFATRASDGLTVYKGILKPQIVYQQTIDRKILKENGQSHVSIKFCEFSPDGKYFAYCDGVKTSVLLTTNWTVHLTLDGDHGKNSAVHFSPQSNFFCTWRVLFSTAANQTKQAPNLFIFDLNTKAKVAEFVDKNRQQKWQPYWTEDETICARLVGSELLFHENNYFDKYAHKLVLPKMNDYSLSNVAKFLHIAAYVPVGKDTPAIVRVYQYPNFQNVVNAKSFFKADRVSMQWNKKGSAVIIMAITDIDSTGQSYYGEQNLYFVSVQGDSYMVPLGKNGPVYYVEWNPLSTCYCVVYGYMPAKATLYNLKGDIIYDFGTGPRNEAHYDPFGKVLCLCGFGNLRGNMEFFHAGVGKENARLSSLKAEDTTVFKWCPDGRNFITATTAPRLRVNNGWKIWRYDGQVVEQFSCKENEELWEVQLKPEPTASEQPVLECKVSLQNANSNSNSSLPGVNSSGAYVPPHMRTATATTANKPTFKLHEYELPSNEKKAATADGKHHKKATFQNAQGKTTTTSATSPTKESSDENDPAKKIKNLNKKLEQIKLLKEKMEKGEKLEVNQRQKIEKEQELLDELESLKLM